MTLTISINISAYDLFIPKLPLFIKELITTHGISPQSIVLEITESSIMLDPQGALDILNELHDMGLLISVDDFGTGYSSLSYLKKLPVSELKIDSSFVSHMENDKDDSIIVRSTIDLAHNMGLMVVAEGVENETTFSLLQSMGCDLLQGYYISHPIPAEAMQQWLTTSQWGTHETRLQEGI